MQIRRVAYRRNIRSIVQGQHITICRCRAGSAIILSRGDDELDRELCNLVCNVGVASRGVIYRADQCECIANLGFVPSRIRSVGGELNLTINRAVTI